MIRITGMAGAQRAEQAGITFTISPEHVRQLVGRARRQAESRRHLGGNLIAGGV